MTVSVNYWPDSKCAKAFWNQNELPPYRELLRDTTAWLDARPGQRWLDLGCGCGRLSQALWERGQGQLAEVLGVDVAAINAAAYARLRAQMQPAPAEDVLHFQAADFSKGFSQWPAERFDGVVSGLALQYAEDYSEATGTWTQAAYDRILAEAQRLLKPGGSFVFSVNVPDPAWSRVAWKSFAAVFGAARPLRYLRKVWRLCRYGNWLKREARRGRFHYLTEEVIRRKLALAGFVAIDCRVSFAGQAYLFRCRKPVTTFLAKSA